MSKRPSAMATGIVEWAARAPERVAAIEVSRTLTIGELDAAAAALAARLLDGAGPRGCEASPWLPVIVNRSVSTVVAMHGVIRAGCAFARIESTLPRDMVAELFARLGHPRRAVVADPRFAALLPEGVEVVAALGHDGVGAAEPQPVDPDAPGRVQFTSGSTGRPKGVVVPWVGLDQMVHDAVAMWPGEGGDGRTGGFVHPLGAPVALRAFALPNVGHAACIADPTAMSVDELLDWFDANRVDSVWIPPSLSQALIRVADGRPRLPSVSLVRSTSEAAPWSLVAPLRRIVGPHVTIRVQYSASEAGLLTQFDVGPDDAIGEGRIPIGVPQPGVELRLEPLADDRSTTQVVVARPCSFGYLDDPELTASRYFTDDEGTRWWRSHDVARVDEAGIYHHLGRADEMVKVKGAFVAPSRVEQALQSIEGIGAAAATLHQGANGTVRVVAHVHVVDDTLTPERVDAQLREQLPLELVPGILVRHDDLPRTERMKVDRRALENRPLVRWRSSPPRPFKSEFEWWCLIEARRIIGLDDVGPEDDLFEAGLDSLGALELGAALADAGFGDFDPPLLLEARTVAGIEAMLGATNAADRSAVVVLNDRGDRPPLFALPGGAGNATEYRFLAEALGPDQPVVVVEMRGMHTAEPPDRTMDARAAQVCGEIEARLGPRDPLVIIGYSGGGPAAYEAAQRMHAAGRPVHVVFLDTAPGTKGRRPTISPDQAEQPDAVPRPTIRRASIKELPGAVRRSARYRWKYYRLQRLVRNPGPPSFDRVRYLALRQIQMTWNDAYDPEPAAFPATLVTVEGTDALRRCRDFIPDLSVHELGGNHRTMLESPYVDEIATIVAAVAENCFASTRSDVDVSEG